MAKRSEGRNKQVQISKRAQAQAESSTKLDSLPNAADSKADPKATD